MIIKRCTDKRLSLMQAGNFQPTYIAPGYIFKNPYPTAG